MERVLFFIDHLSQWTGKAFAWSMLILTFATSYEVFVRYVIRNPTAWAFDLSYIMYGTMFMMAGAYALSQKAHVRGDFIYRLWPPRVQAGIDLVLYFLFFFPGMIALVYAGYVYAAESWAYRPYGVDGLVGEVSINSPVGVPVSPLKTILPVAAFLLVLQGIAETIRCIQCLRTGAWPQRLKDVEELETQMIREHQEKLAAMKREEELEAQKAAPQDGEGNEGAK
ncbi:MAG: TRAP transporter small permease subunit [Deltaproteobacteria bacterium]|nr:MAG: TRAP transporter small permease subunit [Deltaproteobacteria bacterium]